jgi:cobalt-zinc-cadmium efflux system outer membrane protein
MSHLLFARLFAAALLLHSVSASAEQIEIDLPAAIERAHKAAPVAVSARGEVEISRGAAIGASVPFLNNPEVEAGIGPRLIGGRPIDAEIRVEQNLEPWRRDARRRLARAGVAMTTAEMQATLRDLDFEVVSAFYEGLFAQRTAELAKHGEEFARRASEAADRRRKAGEVTDLDANLARTAHGRARSATRAAESQRAGVVGRLAALIGATPGDTIVLRGDLKAALAPDVAALQSAVANRPDVRVLDTEGLVARTERDQARASGRPELSVWASYHREDTDSIVLGGLRLTLPMWNRAQGDKAAAVARERRARETRDATVRVGERQVVDAVAAYTSARDAVAVFETDVAPLLDDSEQLLQKTIDAGQIAVSDYLVARQEILNGRREYLERLLALAKAAAAVRFVAGGAP